MHPASLTEAKDWFRASRFGLFVHWGLYAVPAGCWKGRKIGYIGEWTMHGERIPIAEYEQLASRFNPVGFDAKTWVRMAEDAGARYLVLTAKHHEGFAMYHSRVDRFNIVDATPFKRDPLAELAEACSGTSVRLGIYYSQCVDWHEPHGGNLPDDWKGDGRTWGNDWDFPAGHAAGFTEYLERKVKPQLNELLTQYGQLSVLWFDTPTPSLSTDEAKLLYNLVREKQPACLMCSRLGIPADYETLGDNQSPVAAVDKLTESCITMNETWGYKDHDQEWKSTADMVNMLSDLASKNCNFLLNLGPQPDGRIPHASVERLAGMGRWLRINGEAIHDAEPAPVPTEPPWGRMTRKGSRLFLHVTEQERAHITLRGLRVALRKASLLGGSDDTRTLNVDLDAVIPSIRIALPPLPSLGQMPRVVQLDLADEPVFDATPAEQDDGMITVGIATIRGDVHGLPWNGWGGVGEGGHGEIRFDRPGDYELEVHTGGVTYGQWNGGHQIEIRVGTEAKLVIIRNDGWITSLRTRHYPTARTCGPAFRILRAGIQPLHISILHVESPGPLFIPRLIFRSLTSDTSPFQLRPLGYAGQVVRRLHEGAADL